MPYFPENSYQVTISENLVKGEFSLWFEAQPEDLIYNLVRAVGFKPRSNGREFYHAEDQQILEFANQLQESLSVGCLPKEIPYTPAFPITAKTIDKDKFSVVTLRYKNAQGVMALSEVLVFEPHKDRREGFGWLIGWMRYGDQLVSVDAPETSSRVTARKLLREDGYEVSLPDPFGVGCHRQPRADQDADSGEDRSSDHAKDHDRDRDHDHGEDHDRDHNADHHHQQGGNNPGNTGENEQINDRDQDEDHDQDHGHDQDEDHGTDQDEDHDYDNGRGNPGRSSSPKTSSEQIHLEARDYRPYQAPANLAALIPVKKIEITGEGTDTKPDFEQAETFDNWNEANAYVELAVAAFSILYCRITWEDGFQDIDIIDLEPASNFLDKPDLLSKHIDFHTWMTATDKTVASIIGKKRVNQAAMILETYAFYDLPNVLDRNKLDKPSPMNSERKHRAANQPGSYQPPANLSDLIQVDTIRLTGIGSNANPVYELGKSLGNWHDANDYVQMMVGHYSDAYFEVTWADGFIYAGQFDLEPSDDFKGKPDLLSKRLDYYQWHLSNHEPDTIYGATDIAAAKDLIENYAFYDSANPVVSGTSMNQATTDHLAGDSNPQASNRSNQPGRLKIPVQTIEITTEREMDLPNYSAGKSFQDWSKANNYVATTISRVEFIYIKITWADGETYNTGDHGMEVLGPEESVENFEIIASYVRKELMKVVQSNYHSEEAKKWAKKIVSDYQFSDADETEPPTPSNTEEAILTASSPSPEQDFSDKGENPVASLKKSQYAPPPQIAPVVQPYTRIYRRLYRLMPNLIAEIDRGVSHAKSEIRSAEGEYVGLMDASFNFLYKDSEGRYIISLAHYFEQEGDLIADPDMEIRIDPVLQSAEALAIQTQFGYRTVYSEDNGKRMVNTREKKDQNKFLAQWLMNMIHQGHSFDLSQLPSEDELEEETEDEFVDTLSSDSEEVAVEDDPFPIYKKNFSEALDSGEQKIAFDAIVQLLVIYIEHGQMLQHLPEIIEMADHPKIRGYVNKHGFSFIQSFQSEGFLKELDQNLWNFVPDSFKKAATPARINWQSYPHNSGLRQLIQPFTGESFDSPVVQGVLFDEFGIVATNKNKLLFLANPTDGTTGVFCMTKNCWESVKKKTWKEIKANLESFVEDGTAELEVTPLNYHTILRDTHSHSKTISTLNFYRLVTGIIKARLVYKKQPHLHMEVGGEYLGVNPFYLQDILKAFIHLEVEQVDVGYEAANKGIYFTPVGKLDEVTALKTDFAVLMPMVVGVPDFGTLVISTTHESVETIGFSALDKLRESTPATLEKSAEPTDPEKTPLSQISLRYGASKVHDETNHFWTWTEAEAFLVSLESPTTEDSITIHYEVSWKTGFKAKGKLRLFALGYNPALRPKLLREVVVEDFLNSVYGLEGRIPKEIKPEESVGMEQLQKLLTELDFGFDPKEFIEAHQPRIPIEYVKVDLGESIVLGSIAYKEWEYFAKASADLRHVQTLFGIKDSFPIKARWKDGTELETTIAPIRIPDAPDQRFWEAIFNDKLGANDLVRYQTADDQAVLFDNEIDLPNPAKYLAPLLPAYWRNDDIDKSQRVNLEHGQFHKGRMRNTLLTILGNEPIKRQKEIADLVTENMDHEKPYQHYINTVDWHDKTAEEQIMEAVKNFIFDVIRHYDSIKDNVVPLYNFLVKHLAIGKGQVVDLPTSIKSNIDSVDEKEITAHPSGKGNNKRAELNRQIERLIDEKQASEKDYTPEEKELLKSYTGWGGLDKGSPDAGMLYEYYTPDPIVERMWALAYQHGYNGGDVLEPTVGTGNFLKYAPVTSRIVGYETNKYSARICQVLYPHAQIYNRQFESIFFNGNIHLKDNFRVDPFDLVIGNPPYGEFSGKYAGMGEKKFTKATEYDQYFITRGLDVLNPKGLLVFVISSGFLDSKSAYNKLKESVAKKATLLGAYRLPNGVFEHTEVGTDIVVFQKRRAA